MAVLPTEGLNRIAARIEADTPIYVAVGTGSTAPTSGDTQLGTETFREIAESVVRDGNFITVTTTFANADLPATTNEVGLFINAAAGVNTGELLVRATFTFVKGSNNLTVVFEITVAEG